MSFLKDVTPELVYTAEALYEIAADESQRKCLNAISRSQELLCWLQTRIKSII